jgi:plasmid stabilization system protein ParE
MPARFRVEWTYAASGDLTEIQYIARDSPANADRVYRRIRRHASTLKKFPGRGRAVPELAYLEILSYRELSVAPYRIIYKIDKPSPSHGIRQLPLPFLARRIKLHTFGRKPIQPPPRSISRHNVIASGRFPEFRSDRAKRCRISGTHSVADCISNSL